MTLNSPPLCPRLLRPFALDPHRIAPDKTGHALFALGDPEIRHRLETVVGSFATGYNAALAVRRGPLDLGAVPHELRGFAHEGAAMSRTLLDLMTLSRGRGLNDLLAGSGRRYLHLIDVGAGWAFARLRVRPWRGIKDGTGLSRWLAWDGWGFHQAYFHPETVFARQRIERAARGAVRPVRDQGIGRALWFHTCADPAHIARIIGAFPAERRADVWAGIGLAAVYTGAQPPEVLARLSDAAAGHRDHLAQGAAFAAKAHVLSGEVPDHCEPAALALCGVPVKVAAGWTDAALAEATGRGDGVAAYQFWRARIRNAWQNQSGGVPT
ncbi:DUF1702 family protein [Actinomadura xylanilytica]|uniref:DUF1702 family protein n=1 Tax=Actinomadura xylanilytica TaxID=887459 RepID=UPI00255A8424|nr:DUF1702 family protein [Actinomadura xylanilytica]MDL4776721.1 DUF1702 family protein [Actinomadura xylanilytica]